MIKRVQSQSIVRLLQLANQKAQANQNSQAARFYWIAGEKAAAQIATNDALTYLNKALALMNEANLADRFQILFIRQELYALHGKKSERDADLVSLATLAEKLDDDQKQAAVAVKLALAKYDNGEFQDSINIARLALRLAQISEAINAEAGLFMVWGRALQRLGDAKQAEHKLKRALKLSETAVLSLEQAQSWHYLGVLHEENGRFTQATSEYNKALSQYREINYQPGIGRVLNNLGNVAYNQSQFGDAVRYWDEAYPIYQLLDDKSGNCRLLLNQSNASMDMGQYEQAQRYTEQALSISQEIGLKFGEALANVTLGLAHHYQGHHDKAQVHAQAALTLATEMESRRLQGYAYNTLGHALAGAGRHCEASNAYWEAYAIWYELDQAALAVEAQAGLLGMALETGDGNGAAELLTDIMAHLEQDASLDGTESPFRVYWQTYSALVTAKDLRAVSFLKMAHERLMTIAQTIVKEETRHAFLQQVKVNAALSQAFAQPALA